MKVRMKTLLAGPELTVHPGSLIEVSEEVGKALVAGGYAEEVGQGKTPQRGVSTETAMAGGGEKAVAPAQKATAKKRK